MQFSVIVGAPANKISATEDAVAELERYLLSAQISPKVLEGIEPGKPHILKKELSYEQAVNLSDRLMDFGLESEIHPPTKPEALKTMSKPQPPILSESVKSNHLANTATAKKTSPTKTMQKKANNGQNGKVLGGQKETISKKPTPKITSKPNTTVNTHDQLNKKMEHPTFKEQAEEIKSLFKIKKTGLSSLEISKLDVTRSYFTAFISLALPTIYILGATAIAIAGILLAVILYGMIANFSTTLWILSLLLLSTPLIILAGLFSIPFFIKNKTAPKKMALTAKDEPRLFMLTAAVCKVIGATTPNKIMVSLDGEFHGNFSNPEKNSLTSEKTLEKKPSLTVCSSLLNSLSIRQYCALVSRELGKQQYEELRRPNAISNRQLNRLKNLKEKPKSASALFSSASNKISNEKIKHLFERFLSLTEIIEYLHETYFSFSYQLLSNRLKNDSISKRFQSNIFGAKPEASLAQLETKLEHLSASRHEAIETMTKENESHRYAASLPDLIEHIEEKHGTDNEYKTIEDSLIPKDGKLKTLLDNFSKCSALLTKDFYASYGIDLEQAQLLSIDNLLKKENRDAKIEKIADEYFGKWHHGLQVWRLPKEAVLASVDRTHLVSALNNSINKLRYLSPDRPALIEKYYRQLKQLTELRAAKKIRSTGVEYKLTSVPENTINLDAEIASRETQLHDINIELTQQNSAMGERLALGLLLDKDHQQMTAKLFSALSVISDCASEINNIAARCEELQTLISNAPKRINQHFNLQLKKVKDSIDSDYKILNRKLKKCQYDYIDQRYDSVFSLLQDKTNHTTYSTDENKRTLQKAKIALTVVATSYKAISDLAANYATRMERLNKIQAIRKL